VPLSKEQHVPQLLKHEEMGDRRPTQFLRHLRTLAGRRTGVYRIVPARKGSESFKKYCIVFNNV
jgi:hypothetical protein